MKLGVLASGNLGFEILQKINEDFSISFALTDSASESIINFCNDKRIPVFKGNPRNGNVSGFIADKACDILLSINYLFLIEKDLISLPSRFAINIHGSLLPKYRGRTPHVWAIINNEKSTGITAHLISEACDKGDIIAQVEIPIDDNDTGADILFKYNQQYWPLIQEVLSNVNQNKVTFQKQDESKATYFGKRTPEDGAIEWDWQKERIYNWVRAQAHPYPGAFTYINEKKLTIDKVSFADDGYHFDLPNGTVISTNPLKVKTPNGVLSIDSVREKNIQINKNQILG